MTNAQWAVVVVAIFVAATLVWFKRAKKDMFGAIAIGVFIILVSLFCLSVSGCSVTKGYQPWMEAGFAYDRNKVVGDQPTCVIRLRQPLVPDRVVLGFTHHSSCSMQDDRGEVNQVELMGIIPLGRSQ